MENVIRDDDATLVIPQSDVVEEYAGVKSIKIDLPVPAFIQLRDIQMDLWANTGHGQFPSYSETIATCLAICADVVLQQKQFEDDNAPK